MTNIVEIEDYGRVIIANENYAIGDLVLEDAPLLIFADEIDMILSFIDADESVQSQIINMNHPSLDIRTSRLDTRKSDATAIYNCLKDTNDAVNVMLILKLLMISDTNAHSYLDTSLKSEKMKVDGVQGKNSAFFHYGSKAEHSCCPNVTNSTTSGILKYTAIRNIAVGERISFAYLSLIDCTDDRRVALLDQKNFMCSCKACIGEDHFRGIKCPKSGCNCIALQQIQNVPNKVWNCAICGVLKKHEVTMLLDLEQHIQCQYEYIQTKPLHEQYLSKIDAYIIQASDELSLNHILVIKFLRFYVKICASHLNQMEMYFQQANPQITEQQYVERWCAPCKTTDDIRVAGALAGMKAVQLYECGYAQCHEVNCEINHDPSFVIVTDIFWALSALANCKANMKDSVKRTFMRLFAKYFTFMKIQYGVDNNDLHTLNIFYEKMLELST